MNIRNASIALVIASALVATSCGDQVGQEELPTPTPLPAPVIPTKPTYVVQRGEVVRRITFTGRIGPVREVDLFFRVSGRVRSVNTERRAQVKQGDILADLENAELERQLQQLELELDRARIRLERAQKAAESAAARAKVDLQIKQLEYARLKSIDMEARKKQAEIQLRQAEIAVEVAQSEYDRSPIEGRSGSWQAMALQNATLNYQLAKANYDLVMQEIITNHQYNLKILAQQVAAARQGVVDAETSVDQLLVNDVKSAELNVESLRARIADAQIIAPFDGEIMSLSTAPGLPVEAYKPVMVIADPTELEVVADPGTNLLKDLQEGLIVDVTLVSVPEKPMKGKIRQLPYPYGGGGRTAQGIEPPNADKSTRISLDETTTTGVRYEMGDLVRVNVILERVANALWIPPQAVRTFEGRKFVVIQEGEAQRRVDVKVGITGEDRVEILEGLQEGQVVIAP
ncbi:MAG: efflux RND transporter periplasmic adaptor subunit [Anaerolineae bacterium]|nr:efflux RND transporter periplasmic adaptor subunit [Thermoflexales bacterium]MDW8408349.1 efflux RND transporter periplasmic adaptor subunit [Anaerolineae bacterium]